MKPSPFSDIDADDEDTLVDVLDRVLDTGLVVSGDLRLSVADIDLVYVGLKVVAASIDKIEAIPALEDSFIPRLGNSAS